MPDDTPEKFTDAAEAVEHPLTGDQPVDPDDEARRLTVLTAIDQAYQEAKQAKLHRDAQNQINQDAFLGRQDWSYKTDGQSQEFLPKVPMAVEQIVAFIKKALVDYGSWFTLDLPKVAGSPPVIRDEAATELLRCFLEQQHRIDEGRLIDFPTIVGDALKGGLLKSLIIFKVHGRIKSVPVYAYQQGEHLVDEVLPGGRVGKVPIAVQEVVKRRKRVWRLMVEFVNPSSYFPDPTGRRLYEIHRVERDLHDVQAMAEGPDPIYDPEIVALIKQDYAAEWEAAKQAAEINQTPATRPAFRKTVVIDEYWGHLLNDDGELAQENIVCARANEKYLIREPEPNPNWHGQSPFVACPLLRVPDSVWHKALMDHAVPLNLLANELFNLMVDGGLAAVWGIRQVRKNWMDNPAVASGGFAQGATVVVNDECPVGGKVLEKVTEGAVPPEALAMYNIVDREHQAATLVNDIKLGLLPAKQVKATEVVEATQQAASFFDGMLRDVEQSGMEPLLWKAWLTVLQHWDYLEDREVEQVIGQSAAMEIRAMKPNERFLRFGQGCELKVFGLSSVLARVREFQKMMAMMQAVGTNPILLQTFFRKYSPDKMLEQMFKALNIDPRSIEMTEEELRTVPERLRQLPMFQQLTAGTSRQTAAGAGEQALPGEINQAERPATGLTGGMT